MNRRKATISRKHAQSLHADIRRHETTIHRLGRELQHEKDEISEAKDRANRMEIDRDALAIKLNKMGEDLGLANGREVAAREIAAQLLDGLNTVTIAAQSLSVPSYLTRTLLTLQRDGRAQLKGTNGAHA